MDPRARLEHFSVVPKVRLIPLFNIVSAGGHVYQKSIEYHIEVALQTVNLHNLGS